MSLGKSIHEMLITFTTHSSPWPCDWMSVSAQFKWQNSSPISQSLNVRNMTLSSVTGFNVDPLQLGAQAILSDYIQPVCLVEPLPWAQRVGLLTGALGQDCSYDDKVIYGLSAG